MARGKRKRPSGDASRAPQAHDGAVDHKAAVRPLLLVVVALIVSGAVAFLLFGGAIDVNPADESVWLATNTGLFRIPTGGGDPEKITGTLSTREYGSGEISQELAIRFEGPDELLASGHPPPDSSLPSVLGLIRSNDAGKTWTEISGTGTADYHALQLSGGTLV